MIKDSGERVSFETGAVRDIQDDKGRCDLMPLDILGEVMFFYGAEDSLKYIKILGYLDEFKRAALSNQEFSINPLLSALHEFISIKYNGDYIEAMLELSIHFREGAEKYGEDNWKKGIPEWSYLSSAVRHLLKCIRGDSDENHKRSFMWNIVCLMWTMKENTKQ